MMVRHIEVINIIIEVGRIMIVECILKWAGLVEGAE
jgi:hypothetical protein